MESPGSSGSGRKGEAKAMTSTPTSGASASTSTPNPPPRHDFQGGSARQFHQPTGGRVPNQAPRRQMVAVPPPVDWQHYSSISIRIRGIPSDVSTWDIWRSFNLAANVQCIDIFENRQGQRSGHARVRMEPPMRNLWPRKFCMLKRPHGADICVPLDIDATGFVGKGEQVNSPLGKPVPATMKLVPSALHFGFMHQRNAMMDMRSIHAGRGGQTLSLAVDFKKRLIQIYFNLEFIDPTLSPATLQLCNHRIEVRFSRLTRLTRPDLPGGRRAVVISLQHPPPFFREVSDARKTHSAERLHWNEVDLWRRQVTIEHDERKTMDDALALGGKSPKVDIGRWTTYYLEFDAGSNADIWSKAEQYLSDFNIPTVKDDKFEMIPRAEHKLWETLDGHATAVASGDSALSLLRSAHLSLAFPVRYQLEACISRGILLEHNIDSDFLANLDKLDPTLGRLLLEHIADKGHRIYDPSTVLALANEISENTDLEGRGTGREYLTLTRKVTVTPSTHYLSTPAFEMNNRVLRKYSHLNGNFIRVQFTDEIPEGRINPSSEDRKNDGLYTRVYRVLLNGIRIGGRHYEFLAFGNSQLRENGAYFFSPTNEVTCESIRKWMGDFASINVVAKYAARIGQCFSTTRDIAGYPVPKLVEIRDVENNGHVFTDGVGKISQLWASIVADHMNHKENPSAIQFRMGGCKGVLAVWDDCRSLEVHVRPTQQKFKGAVFNGLEVIRLSVTTASFLNQQTILILSGLGVRNDVFLRLLDRDIDAINAAMTDKSAAVTELTRRVDENQTTLTMAKMVANGFMEVDEPFMWTLLQLWRSHSLKFLKEKAKISVEEGAFVLGIADETGTLRGHSKATETDESARRRRELLPQIFLQVPDRSDNDKYKVITGLCLVGRNPSLHPGDIRVVEAVDVRELRHLKDVVVFPTKGDRDVPGMLSGGDLDGDDFFVMWNKDLIPDESQWNLPPMDYTGPEVSTVRGGISMTDLSAFFVLYMKNDSLPRIALAHRAHADRLDTGVKHPRCLQLAQLHSRAVDYVKTGVPAEMPKNLNPMEWPHWMEKRGGRKYHSQSVLGKLYDKTKTADFHPVYDKPFDNRILKRFSLPKDVLKAARKIKSKYDTALRRLMGSKEIDTEFEVWSAFILTRPRVGSGYKLAEDIGREAGALKRRFRDACITAAGGRGPETLHPFVAAMYKVTQEEVRIALYECGHTGIDSDGRVFRRQMKPASMPLISFPWLFDRELGLIATGMTREPDLKVLTALAPAPAREPRGEEAPQDIAAEMGKAAVKVAAEMDLQELLDMDYVRTADGVVTHRGEPLTLFGHLLDDDGEEQAGDDIEYVGVIRDEGGASGEDDGAGSSQSPTATVPVTQENERPAYANMELKGTATNGALALDQKKGSPAAVANGDIVQPLAPRPWSSPNKVVPSTLLPDLFETLRITFPSKETPSKGGETSTVYATPATQTDGVNGTPRGAGSTTSASASDVGGDATEEADEGESDSEIEIVDLAPGEESALARATRLFGE